MTASVLLLHHCEDVSPSNAIRHNVGAFEKYSRHRIFPVDTFRESLDGLDLNQFDVILIHWTLVVAENYREGYFGPGNFERLVDFSGAKMVFVQDEYRWIDQTIAAVSELRARALFSALCPQDMGRVYDDRRLADVEIVGVLTGYLEPEIAARPVVPFEQREIDVGYRGRDLSGAHAWIGGLAQEKCMIARRFLRDVGGSDLKLDISNAHGDRLSGDQWLTFLGRCKSQLGTESGASLCDFDDSIRRRVLAYVASHSDAEFEEIREACFPGKDWKTPARGMSPRSLECAAMRTLMINYEGDYHGLLTPWVHYVPLKKDHSNLPEVLSVIREDHPRARSIIARAHEDIGRNPEFHYPRFVEIVDREIDPYAPVVQRAGAALSRESFELHKAVRKSQELLLSAQGKMAGLGDSITHQQSEIVRLSGLMKESRKGISELRRTVKDSQAQVRDVMRLLDKSRARQRTMMRVLLVLSGLMLAAAVWILSGLWRMPPR